jgi:hypothetical protein
MNKEDGEESLVWGEDRDPFPMITCSLDFDISKRKGNVYIRAKGHTISYSIIFVLGFTLGVITSQHGLEIIMWWVT